MTMVHSGGFMQRAALVVFALVVPGPGSWGGVPESGTKMETREVPVQRMIFISSKPFNQVIAALESKIGHPDMVALRRDITAAKTETELESVVNKAVGPAGLMEFARFDLGEVLRKELGPGAPESVRLLVGNPLIMKQMVKIVPDAGSYAPVTILIDRRPDGVHVSYDRMASFLAPYKNPQAMKVARDLDSKVESLLRSAAD
jgi:uncharacterized protein (DUF302 family)